MVGVLRRMNVLRALLNIRHGPGAAVLPQDVTRIHLEFAMKMNDGHMGPKKFWRENLPRLKFWNPAVPMIVNRTPSQTGAATLSVYFRDDALIAAAGEDAAAAPKADSATPTSSSSGHAKAPAHTQGERVVTIDMKNRRSEMILKDFLDATGAVPVVPTNQEEIEMKDMADLKRKSEIDMEIGRKIQEARKREEAILAQARSEAAAIKASQ
ncbi:CI-B8 domain-containing protein [Bombardia bombarda]|uniref:CI-B8 domain-containing protein n=1 Tax=Bombardia bombarda TaxID=252184 RepID=A0AA40CDB3_9PEZI|nr:CI-B8 domain-containing protein [Bombardia bombarda]